MISVHDLLKKWGKHMIPLPQPPPRPQRRTCGYKSPPCSSCYPPD